MPVTSKSVARRRSVFGVARFASGCILFAALAACGSDSTGPDGSITVTPVTQTIEATATLDLDATVKDASDNVISNPTVAWSSNNTGVATVDPATGLVTGVGRGTATITATSGGKSATADITVQILYRSVTGGDYLSCDLASIGRTWCWGELGDATGTTVNMTPQLVGGTTKFASLSAYADVVCGLTSAGAAYCWGYNGYGQLGIGTFDAGRKTPTAVIGGVTFKSISVGDLHTCGVSTTGIGYCWGVNTYAQGGHSNTANVATPTVVQGGHTWATISAGTLNSCGLTTAGAAYCWGSDTYGQLGDGGTISGQSNDTSATPRLVSGGHTWSTVSTGQFHSCGLTTAGAAYCWGFNDYRLGNGDATATNQPAPVAVLGGHVFKAIDSGRYTTCGITTANIAYCWGANLAGQYGVELPVDLSRVPVQAVGGMLVSEINTSSMEHTCAVSLDRLTVKCFGRNDFGQTGSGTTVVSTQHNWQPTTVVGQAP